jgi:hypothetical protein
MTVLVVVIYPSMEICLEAQMGVGKCFIVNNEVGFVCGKQSDSTMSLGYQRQVLGL